jgi:hypothetical protein
MKIILSSMCLYLQVCFPLCPGPTDTEMCAFACFWHITTSVQCFRVLIQAVMIAADLGDKLSVFKIKPLDPTVVQLLARIDEGTRETDGLVQWDGEIWAW